MIASQEVQINTQWANTASRHEPISLNRWHMRHILLNITVLSSRYQNL